MVNVKKPVRTCLSCREAKLKKELLRIVRQKDGSIVPDLTGKAEGRGAYICKTKECLEAARKGKKFSKAFSCPVDDEIYDKIAIVLDSIVSL